ncbi:1,4-alpha-glucan branching protein GlgB [Shewanella pneumatophori]|uniref:1,4-alpha-glucan branching enzyme GlgB n=1 Tax=Shewanella pneumatophori TaxID=314092 RepID=A0A9X1ZED3_9GAMM|nr:1,4-alpha-glucan branching protein GlgB [Shewanella pneumatophori]MCL1140138.1 1,4-alpha-glucan branching protein GlgB [Shewanella pneumatophori]
MTQNAPEFQNGVDIALLNSEYIDVFGLLGMHSINQGKALSVRCFLRGALKVDVICHKTGRKIASLEQSNEQGLFSGIMGRRVKPFLYKLRVEYPLSQQEIVDPYQFASLLSEDDTYLFNEGLQLQAYQFLGANWRETQGVTGVHFCVWAPNAKRVSLLGDFNHWDGAAHVMRQHLASGLWEIFLPNAEANQHYKFEIITANNERLEKSDPYAKAMQEAPSNASLVPYPNEYQWQDNNWLSARKKVQWHQAPMSIYEVHLASWRRKGDNGEQYLNYQDLIDQLVPYVVEMGFTHLQLMPISEYPFDGSWGYQPVGLYAPSHRFGDANGLKAFIDACHQAGIAVVLDWVAAHFPKDPHGLTQFDGSCLYEHNDPRQGEHPDWDTLIYNYGRGEVQSYLLSNAHYWLSEFHFDGLRLDAVSSMLYLDYSREPGQWLPNQYGGRENLAAISFLQTLNQHMYQAFPGVCMIAEESTAWPGVTHMIGENEQQSSQSLGFGFKWNMGWMNDSLGYLKRDPIYRSHHHQELTFSLVYQYTEQFILSLSHDEVVHGKGSLLHKIPNDDWQKFATLRAYYGFMWGHPGKKLLFMGNEFAQRDEWNHNKSLDWHLLQYAPHQGMQLWLKDLNKLYQSTPELWLADGEPSGFQWLDCNNDKACVLSFMRKSTDSDTPVIFIINMTPEVHQGFRIGLPDGDDYIELLNSDSEAYGGSNVGNSGVICSQKQSYQGFDYSAEITVAPLSCLVLGKG